MRLLTLVLLAFGSTPALAAPLEGFELFQNGKTELKPGSKGSVLLFLSARCPCSNSHVPVVKKLARDFPDFSFYAIHSNREEPVEEARKYFESQALGFPVLRDEKQELADRYKALKTPHAYVLAPSGELLYQGGVTSSNNAPDADKQYLRDALADLGAGRGVKLSSTRTLGCLISRGK